MKKLVLQVQIDPKLNKHSMSRTFNHVSDLYALSELQAKKYAQICGAEYLQINDCSFLPNHHPCFQRLKLFDLPNYDSILYLDSDAVILDNIPNIFDLYAHNEFCATWDINWDSDSQYYKKVIKTCQKRYGASESYKPFCSGVMLINKTWIEKAKDIYVKYLYEFQTRGYYDQGVMNKCVVDLGEQYTQLPEDWGAWYKTAKYIVHLATVKKKNFNLEKFVAKHL